jgi:hypothetical protein
MKPPPQALLALADKYRQMRAMRCSNAAEDAPDPRAQMRALAARFPGALREIDELSMDVIDTRIAQLDAAVAGGQIPQWAGWVVAYHGWMRAALRIKGLLVRYADLEPQAVILAHYHPAADEPPTERLDGSAIEAIASPPGGRLNPWVLDQVALDAGADVALIRTTLFRK